MEITNARINIFIGAESTTIELFDKEANTMFAKATLTPQQLSEALSRLSRTDCKIEVNNLDRVGKKMEHTELIFEVSDYAKGNNQILKQLTDNACPEGWEPDYYFGSQSSFFQRNGKQMAKTIIRRWI